MEEPAPITRIAFVDDHHLVRTALVALVNGFEGYKVVLEAANGVQMVKAMEEGAQADIAIVDLNMPVMDGYATLEWLAENRPMIRPIALTFDAKEDAVIRATRNGARGYLLKDVNANVFKLALDRVRDSGYYENELVRKTLIASSDPKTTFERQQAKVLAAITAREMEIIRLACAPEEYMYEEIAERIGIKPSTVESHRKELFARFGIKTKAGLVIFAYRWGIVKAKTH